MDHDNLTLTDTVMDFIFEINDAFEHANFFAPRWALVDIAIVTIAAWDMFVH